jgi:predicted nucleic acid-binding protein
VLTRPQAFANPAPISTLAAQVRAFESRFQIAEEGAQVTSNLLALLTQVPTGGKQVHDANLVATMQVYGVRRLLTHNAADFKRFSQFIEIVPVL